jgi:opacity protein-like surface antigen
MKRPSMTAAFLIFMLVSAHALAVDFGAKIGLALADQDFEYTDFDMNWDSRTGIQFGAFVGFPVSENLVFSPEIQYVPKGVSEEFAVYSYAGPIEDSTIRKTARIDYLSVSLPVKVGLPLGKFTPYLIAGPRIDFQVGIKNDDFMQILYEEFDKVAYGLTLGAGGEISVASAYRLLFEVSYSPDLTKVYDGDAGAFGTLSVKNRTVSFLVGVLF